MPEMLSVTALIVGKGSAAKSRSLPTADFPAARTASSSATSAPEAQAGGPIALLQNGDLVTIDSETQEISFDVTAEELAHANRHGRRRRLKVKRRAREVRALGVLAPRKARSRIYFKAYRVQEPSGDPIDIRP